MCGSGSRSIQKPEGSSTGRIAEGACGSASPVAPVSHHAALIRRLMGEGCIPIRQIRGWVEETGFDSFNEVEIFSTRLWAGDQEAFLGRVVEAYLAKS